MSLQEEVFLKGLHGRYQLIPVDPLPSFIRRNGSYYVIGVTELVFPFLVSVQQIAYFFVHLH